MTLSMRSMKNIKIYKRTNYLMSYRENFFILRSKKEGGNK